MWTYGMVIGVVYLDIDVIAILVLVSHDQFTDYSYASGQYVSAGVLRRRNCAIWAYTSDHHRVGRYRRAVFRAVE